MISTLLTALLVIVAITSLLSLADSALRARHSWIAIRREMALQTGQIARADVSTNVSSIGKRPVVVTLRPAVIPRPAPRLPQAVAA